MTLDNPGVADHIFLCDVEVWAGTSPNPSVWTDLDLSAVVGSNPALCVMRWKNANGFAASTIAFRPKGETEYVDDTLVSPFVCGAPTDGWGIVLALTDSAGICQYKIKDMDKAAQTIDIIGYVK
ncbi:unnamed protein product [marine sediment metagenome]|uniref:Uncharacterized protein n=1 Tax=marine sediment metagenome TaxID=412755 RepID=X1LPZ9_9ZZZZ